LVISKTGFCANTVIFGDGWECGEMKRLAIDSVEFIVFGRRFNCMIGHYSFFMMAASQ